MHSERRWYVHRKKKNERPIEVLLFTTADNNMMCVDDSWNECSGIV